MLSALLWISGIHALFVLLYGINQPVTDWFGFRQTQTALSVFWLLKGGPWLAYETPVIGSPWSIPFEFPLYQLVVAAVAKVGLTIEVAGRLVSFAFFLGCIPAFRKIIQAAGLPAVLFPIVAVLFLTSPIYLFWSRTLMIESCALFFSVWTIYFIQRLINQQNFFNFGFAVVAGILAALVKVTTFAAFLAIGGLMFLPALALAARQRDRRRLIRLIGIGVTLAIAVVGVTAMWIAYTDVVKSRNLVGTMLTSKALEGWNFGTLKQRFSLELWRDVLLFRSIPETLGYAFPLTVPIVGLAVISRRYSLGWALMVLGYLGTFLFFTNLHIVHNYYQYANAIFLISAIGISLSLLIEFWGLVAVVAFLGIVGVLQAAGYYGDFSRRAHFDPSVDGKLIIAEAVKKSVPDGEGVLLIGQSWDSTIPFYSQRRSFSIPPFLSRRQISQILGQPANFFEGTKIGGVLYCYSSLAEYGANKDLFVAFAATKQVRLELPGCNILEP